MKTPRSALACALLALMSPTSLWSQPLPSPTPRELGETLRKMRLLTCDSLTCYYRPRRDYEVRSVTCAVRTPQTVLCTYERTPAWPPGEVTTVREGQPPRPDTRRWSAAETELRRFNDGWLVVADSDD
jgi:hypothetical protein